MNNPKISDTERYVMDYLWSQTAGSGIGNIQRYVEIASEKTYNQQAIEFF